MQPRTFRNSERAQNGVLKRQLTFSFNFQSFFSLFGLYLFFFSLNLNPIQHTYNTRTRTHTHISRLYFLHAVDHFNNISFFKESSFHGLRSNVFRNVFPKNVLIYCSALSLTHTHKIDLFPIEYLLTQSFNRQCNAFKNSFEQHFLLAQKSNYFYARIKKIGNYHRCLFQSHRTDRPTNNTKSVEDYVL